MTFPRLTVRGPCAAQSLRVQGQPSCYRVTEGCTTNLRSNDEGGT